MAEQDLLPGNGCGVMRPSSSCLLGDVPILLCYTTSRKTAWKAGGMDRLGSSEKVIH